VENPVFQFVPHEPLNPGAGEMSTAARSKGVLDVRELAVAAVKDDVTSVTAHTPITEATLEHTLEQIVMRGIAWRPNEVLPERFLGTLPNVLRDNRGDFSADEFFRFIPIRWT